MDIKSQLKGVMHDYPDVYETIVRTTCPDKFDGIPFIDCNDDNGLYCGKCWSNFMRESAE